MPPLMRRRELWWPTLWGGLLLLALLAGLAFALAQWLGGWLSMTAPALQRDGRPASVLVVEGWLNREALDTAAAYSRTRGYARVIVSGGPIDDGFSAYANFAERGAAVLRPKLPDRPVDAVPSPPTRQNRTFASAVWVRDWARQRQLPLDAIDVYSEGTHARRTRLLYAMAFGDATQVGVVAAVPREVDVQRWWTSSEAAKSVLGESISLAWTLCCFWPPPRGSHEERWAVPP